MCNNYKRQMHKHWPLAASSGWRPGLYPCRSCCLHSCCSCCQSCHGPPLSAETVQEKQRKKKVDYASTDVRGAIIWWGVILKPTWWGWPLFPPRPMLAPPPLLMFPLFTGPPLLMGPPLCPMLPLIGPPLGDPPRLGMGPPPRLKFPRLGNPPLKAGGGRKPRGGRLNPPRGPGAADRPG